MPWLIVPCGALVLAALAFLARLYAMAADDAGHLRSPDEIHD